jgi:redox-sensitive bicupin YhaK (pirin superfamily)
MHATSLEQTRQFCSTRSVRAGVHLPMELMDPFVHLGHFYQAWFPPHPYAGVSAVTYLLPDSPGSFHNRWSKGDPSGSGGRGAVHLSVIGPGAIHWTQAGSGMMQEETPTKKCHGIRMFVKLLTADELAPPVVFHQDHPPEVLLLDDRGGVVGKVRVLAGTFQGQSSALLEIGHAQLQYWDVQLSVHEGSAISIPATMDQSSFIFVLNGSVATPDGTIIGPDTAAVFARDGDTVQLTACGSADGGGVGAQFMYCSGTPNREPMFTNVSIMGSFMMSTSERLEQAKVDHANGKMGRLTSKSV